MNTATSGFWLGGRRQPPLLSRRKAEDCALNRQPVSQAQMRTVPAQFLVLDEFGTRIATLCGCSRYYRSGARDSDEVAQASQEIGKSAALRWQNRKTGWSLDIVQGVAGSYRLTSDRLVCLRRCRARCRLQSDQGRGFQFLFPCCFERRHNGKVFQPTALGDGRPAASEVLK